MIEKSVKPMLSVFLVCSHSPDGDAFTSTFPAPLLKSSRPRVPSSEDSESNFVQGNQLKLMFHQIMVVSAYWFNVLSVPFYSTAL